MKTTVQPDWLVPQWPAPVGVRAVFTTRNGGVSLAPFDSMNLGDHVGDLPASVAANRALLQHVTGTHAVFLNQVHGVEAVPLDAASPDGERADACLTAQRKLACTVMVADCLPVLFTTQDGRMVGAAHAGWRGLAGDSSGHGILESIHASFSALDQQECAKSATKIIAWLGPCIGPSAFEVGTEVKTVFEATHSEAALCFVQTGPGKFLASLQALARLRLRALGVTQVYGNDGSAPWCTAGNSLKFFSHRRDTGVAGNGFGTTGRMAACIWID